MHERVRRCEPLRQLQTVAPVGEQRDVGTGARLAIPADHQQMIRRAESRKRLQQHREVLLVGETTRIHQQPRTRRESEPLTQPGPAAFRMEHFGIHAEWLVHRVMYAEAVQELAHHPARCEHSVEALVQPAHVTAEGALTQAAADPAADDLRKIRMIEAHHRDA